MALATSTGADQDEDLVSNCASESGSHLATGAADIVAAAAAASSEHQQVESESSSNHEKAGTGSFSSQQKPNPMKGAEHIALVCILFSRLKEPRELMQPLPAFPHPVPGQLNRPNNRQLSNSSQVSSIIPSRRNTAGGDDSTDRASFIEFSTDVSHSNLLRQHTK